MAKQTVERVEKPWGHELIWAKTEDYVGKILHIKTGQRLSLQYHRVKEETILLARGKMTFVFENEKGELEEILLKEGEAHHIPVGRKHRMVALEDCDVFEVSTPQLDDVVRLLDGYGRAGTWDGRLGFLSPLDGYDAEFRVGEAVTMREGRDLTLVATGGCVGTALAVRDALLADGIAARVLNMHTLKPLDRAAIERAARETGRLLTIEEHSINGGLGGAVAEVLAELGTGRLARVGLRDVFATEVAPYPELLRIHGLDAAGVEAAARELLGRGSKAGRAGIPPAR
jgi:mannose-6-phosphate isomerase